MKKNFFIFSFILLIALTIYINKWLEIENNTNIVEYLQMTQGFTEEEIILLDKMEPLIYAGNINEPPLGIYYKDNGQYLGLMVDYMNAISIELGTEILSRPMVWKDALVALTEEKSDMCDMIPSVERAKKFAFSDPLYFLKGIAVVLDSNEEIETLQDLEGKTIGIQSGDVAIEYLEKMEIIYTVKYMDNLGDALELLDQNKVDVVVGDEPVIRYYLKEISNINLYRILQTPIYEENCVIAVPKDNKELVQILNKAIFNLRRKGTLNQIEKKWSGLSSTFSEDRTDEKMIFGIRLLIAILFVAGYFIYIWNKSLKILVDARTKELELTKNELQIAFDAMKNYMVVINSSGKISNANRVFVNYLNLNFYNINNKKYDTVDILKQANEKNDNIIEKLLSEKKIKATDNIKSYEFKYIGKIFEMIIYKLSIEEKEEVQLLIMFVDKTTEKLEEKRIIHSSKMEAIGRLASGIAHELRNPLGVIRNSTFILNDGPIDDKAIWEKSINAINNSVGRASKIIDNLLNFSRLTVDTKENINICELVDEIVKYFKHQFETANILLDVDCNVEEKLYLNSSSIRHILINLISNSIDAVSEGGNISIKCYIKDFKLILEVKDSGEGIDEYAKNLIYDPFYTTKSPGRGTGLGLYIVYSEVQGMEGVVELESEKNKGTTFKIYIPLEENL